MPVNPHNGVTPWRAPFSYEGDVPQKANKRLTLHFSPLVSVVSPPWVVADFIIRYDKPYDIYDNAAGIIDERSGMWIPGHCIRNTFAGKTHPDFGRTSTTRYPAQMEDQEFWNLWP